MKYWNCNYHVLLYCISCSKIMTASFIITLYTHQTTMNFFLEIIYKTFDIEAKICIYNKKSMDFPHMINIFINSFMHIITIQTNSFIWSFTFNFNSFITRFNNFFFYFYINFLRLLLLFEFLFLNHFFMFFRLNMIF